MSIQDLISSKSRSSRKLFKTDNFWLSNSNKGYKVTGDENNGHCRGQS